MDTGIKAGSYCPVCKGVVGRDCWHDASEFKRGANYAEEFFAAKDEIESLHQQLHDADESMIAVERALQDVDYRGSYADGVKYLKRQLTAVAKERDEIAAQANMLDRMVDERDDQLAAALAACESKNERFKQIVRMANYLDVLSIAMQAHEALTIKPDASALNAHDEALIERCICVVYHNIVLTIEQKDKLAESIRELKGTI